MTSSASPLRSLTVASIAAFSLAVFGCAGRIAEPSPEPSPTNETETGVNATGPAVSAPASSPAPAPECDGRACGADCSPPGSDEPFNCNAAHQCVATGAPLACKACPEFLGDCRVGDEPADLDGDGCIDGCRPIKGK